MTCCSRIFNCCQNVLSCLNADCCKVKSFIANCDLLLLGPGERMGESFLNKAGLWLLRLNDLRMSQDCKSCYCNIIINPDFALDLLKWWKHWTISLYTETSASQKLAIILSMPIKHKKYFSELNQLKGKITKLNFIVNKIKTKINAIWNSLGWMDFNFNYTVKKLFLKEPIWGLRINKIMVSISKNWFYLIKL